MSICAFTRNRVTAFSISVLATVASADPLTLTWNGGENGYLSDVAWSGGVEGHLTPQNGDKLVFSKGGSFTNDIAGLSVSGLSFSSSAAVALNGSEAITVMNGGKVRTSGTGAVTISTPIKAGEAVASSDGDDATAEAVLFAAAGSGRKLTFSGVISGDAPIAVGEANGTVEFKGNNIFTGKLTVTNGFFNAVGVKSLGEEGDKEIFLKTGTGNGRAKVNLQGVEVRRPVRINGNAQNGEFNISSTTQSLFYAPVEIENTTSFLLNGWTTATFKGALKAMGTIQGTVETGSTLKLAGAGSWINSLNIAFTSSASTEPKWYAKYVVGVPLRFTGVDFKHYSMNIRQPRGQFVMEVANAFSNTCSLAKDREVPLRYTGAAESTTFNMNGFDQTFMSIQDEASKSSNVITSDKACVLRLKQNWIENRIVDNTGRVREPVRKDCFSGAISGKVSVSVEGSDSCFFAGPNTSTGAFSLTNAAYSGFTSTGVWKGTNFTVCAGSTLVVSNTAALSAKSCIRLSDAPDSEVKSSILLGEGDYAAHSMSVDGQLLYRGTWGSSQSDARFKDDVHFKGSGVLTLATGAPPGFWLIIR